jgi:putative oxidoreductase
MTRNQPALALLILRVTLGLFLLQWGIEKFVVPENTPGIWGYFYGVNLPQAAAYLFGTVEIALALCFFLGIARTLAYAAGALLHAVSVLVTIPVMLAPFADPVSHLFVAGVPVLGGFIALFLLRDLDTFRLGARTA